MTLRSSVLLAGVAALAISPIAGMSPVAASTATQTVTPVAASSTARAPMFPQPLTVMSWNICGEAGGVRGQAGYCPYRNDPQAKVDVIVDLVESEDLDVIMLQEVCAESPDSHLGLLKAALGDEWQIGHARGARPGGRTDCRGELSGELGVGLAVRAGEATFTSADTLPDDPTGEHTDSLPILCADTEAWTTRVCTTHLLADPADPRRGVQIENVVDYVEDDVDNLVLGGDFNQFPDSPGLQPISRLFDECDGRSYRSGDQVDEITHHAWHGSHTFRKRDHIFASKASEGTYFTHCDSVTELMDDTENEPDSGAPSGYSDHAPVVGTTWVTLRR